MIFMNHSGYYGTKVPDLSENSTQADSAIFIPMHSQAPASRLSKETDRKKLTLYEVRSTSSQSIQRMYMQWYMSPVPEYTK